MDQWTYGGRWCSVTVRGWCRSLGRGQCLEQVQQLVLHLRPCPPSCHVFSAHQRGRLGDRCVSSLQPASWYLSQAGLAHAPQGVPTPSSRVGTGGSSGRAVAAASRASAGVNANSTEAGGPSSLPDSHPGGWGAASLVGSCRAGGSCQPEAATRWGQEGPEFRSRLLATGVLWLAPGPPPQTGGMLAASSGSLVPLPGYQELGPRLFLPIPFLQAAWHRGTRDSSQGLGHGDPPSSARKGSLRIRRRDEALWPTAGPRLGLSGTIPVSGVATS